MQLQDPGTLEMEMMNKKEKKIKIRTQYISLNRNKNETHSNIKYRFPNDKPTTCLSGRPEQLVVLRVKFNNTHAQKQTQAP